MAKAARVLAGAGVHHGVEFALEGDPTDVADDALALTVSVVPAA